MKKQFSDPEEQKQYLFDQITGENPYTGQDRILAFPIEAAVGKTTTMIDALLELYDLKPDIKSLVVTKLIKEATDLQKALGKKVAVAVYSNMKNRPSDGEILNKNVVIITHKKYKDMCMTDGRSMTNEIKLYTTGRTNLIIDEEIQVFETHDVSLSDYQQLARCFAKMGNDMFRIFNTLFHPIWDELKNSSKPMRVMQLAPLDIRGRIELSTLVSELKKVASTEQYYREYKKTMNKLVRIIGGKFSVICNGHIYCSRDTLKYLLLKNNILLDASASLNSVYDISPKISVIDMKRTENHSKWTMFFINANTSTTSKLKLGRFFYNDVAETIVKACSKSDNILIVGSADDVGGNEKIGILDAFIDKLKSCVHSVDMINFEAMRGKNKWSDFNKCFVIHTFTRPPYYYPLLLKYWVPSYPLTDDDLSMGNYAKRNRHFGFKLPLLDELRESDIYSSAYQAVKRINRDNTMKAEIYVICDRTKIKSIIRKNLKNIKIKTAALSKSSAHGSIHYNNTMNKFRGNEVENLFDEILSGKYKAYEDDLHAGHYPKQWIMGKINYSGTHFSRILNGLQEYMDQNNITQSQHHVIFHNLLNR
jgi:hypothetical protein